MAHYIAMSGSRGYLPDHVSVYASRWDAAASMAQMFDLSSDRQEELNRTGWLDCNPATEGAEYIELSMCDCETPTDHDPEYEPPPAGVY